MSLRIATNTPRVTKKPAMAACVNTVMKAVDQNVMVGGDALLKQHLVVNLSKEMKLHNQD